MKRYAGILAVIISVTTYGQELKPTIAFTFLVDDVKELLELKRNRSDELIKAFWDAGRTGVVLISPVETKAKDAKIGLLTDYHLDDGSLALLARQMGAVYGLSVWLRYGTIEGASPPQVGPYLMVRVVRSDGEVTRGRMVIPRPLRKNETVFGVFPEMARKAVSKLDLKHLPAGAEVEKKPHSASSAATADLPTLTQPPPPPPPPPLDDGATQRLLGKIGVGGGAGIAAVGVVLLGLASADNARLTPSAEGNLPADQRPTVQAGFAKQGAGIGLAIAGAVVAATGAVVWGLAPRAPISVSAMPVPSGAGITVGGSFP